MDLYRLFSPRRLQQRAMREVVCPAISSSPMPTCPRNADRSDRPRTGRVKTGCRHRDFASEGRAFGKPSRNINFLFMNEAEARALTGHDSAEAAEWPALLQAAGLSGGVITRGGKPAIAFQNGRTVAVTPPELDTVADVTGAGDALAAGFLSALSWGNRSTYAFAPASPLLASQCVRRLPCRKKCRGCCSMRAIRLVPPAEILS